MSTVPGLFGKKKIVTRQVINIGGDANDGDGDTLRSAFKKTNENFAEIYSAGPVSSNVAISNASITTTATNANLNLIPNGTGSVVVSSDIVPDANNTRTIGSSSLRYKNIYALELDTSISLRVARYASNTERDAQITTPLSGMIIFVESGAVFQGYNGTSWVNLS